MSEDMSADNLLPGIKSTYHDSSKEYVLEKLQLEGVRGFFNCNKCNVRCEGFMYHAKDFILCKDCGKNEKSLPEQITTPGHPDHVLKFHRDIYDHGCNKCRKGKVNIMYRCNDCDYDLCLECSSIPEDTSSNLIVFRKKESPHTLHLIDLTGVRGFYNCSQCRNYCDGFMYQCRDCRDYYLCVDCSRKSSNLTPSVTHPKHPHELQIFKEIDTELIHNCDLCPNSNLKIVYRCHDCDYDVCMDCV